MDRRVVAIGVAALIQIGCSDQIDTGNVGEKFQEGVQGQGKIVPLGGETGNRPVGEE
jgi:hypothetical protein